MRQLAVFLAVTVAATVGSLPGGERAGPSSDAVLAIGATPVSAATVDTPARPNTPSAITQQQFLDLADPQIADWTQRVASFVGNEQSGDSASRAKVTSAWLVVHWYWARLRAASRQGWEANRPSYDSAWEESIRTWNEANGG